MPATVSSPKEVAHDAIPVRRYFSSEHAHPFDEITWKKVTVEITGDKGETVFRQEDVEVPSFWSDLAAKVVVSKYFYGAVGTPERETSVKQLINRVASTIADWAVSGKYILSEDHEVFRWELTWLLVNQHVAFNSPVWFNVGVHMHQQEHDIKPRDDKGTWRWNRNVGRVDRSSTQYDPPQCSACFIQPVGDSMDAIMDLAKSEAMLFKFGSGTGTDLSTLRSTRETLTGGGIPSGPLSFLKVYDAAAGVIKSGGKTRRAAKMNILSDWHPDIEEFIDAKMNEEKKAHALIDAGYDGNFNGEAYQTVAFQNENLSVRVSDEFMQAAEDGRAWTTRTVTTGEDCETKDASKLMDKIAEGTWFCGDPGLQFDSVIQKWHTCKATGPIKATNPCSEYVFLDDTACNLASLNLLKFVDGDEFLSDRFAKAVDLIILAQEVLVDNSSYPTANIAENSHIFRTLGLGYANLGALLMRWGLPYDSEEGRGLAGSITALMTGRAYRQSIEIAKVVGEFPGLRDARDAARKQKGEAAGESNWDSMAEVLKLHSDALEDVNVFELNESVQDAATHAWLDVMSEIHHDNGPRNAQVTVLAPTGTISFLMDCDTTGIEPDIALVKYKTLAGGGMLSYTNNSVPHALKRLGYTAADTEDIMKHIEDTGTIEGCDVLDPNHLPVFDCAFKAQNGERSIPYDAHLRMMAATQPFISGAISKTVNMPKESTAHDIRRAYELAWKLGLKCVAVYRDGSKRSQPLSTSKESLDEVTEEAVIARLKESGYEVLGRSDYDAMINEINELKVEVSALGDMETETAVSRPPDENKRPTRYRLPDSRVAITHKFSIAGHEGYLTVGLFQDNQPGEMFITMAKEGSTIGGLMDSVGTLTSIALQYGVPISVLCRKFKHQRFEPSGFTQHPKVRNASSIIDYVFSWLELQFVNKEFDPDLQRIIPVTDATNGSASLPETNEDVAEADRKLTLSDVTRQMSPDAPPCSTCGQITVRSGNCHKCVNCGESVGCS